MATTIITTTAVAAEAAAAATKRRYISEEVLVDNTFGNRLTLTTFGSSHGEAIGGVVDGFPRGIRIDTQAVALRLARRQTGRYAFSSQRHESDEVRFLSGISDGVSDGFPIAFFIENRNARSSDYDHIKDILRPSHADYTYRLRYGVDDLVGGGRASGRETASWVVAGSLALQALQAKAINIVGYVSQIGRVVETLPYTSLDLRGIDKNPLPTPDESTARRMVAEIDLARSDRDSLGGVVSCVVKGVSAGIGNPIFNKLSSRLAAAMMSIPSAKGFDYGAGFEAAAMRGSEHNDIFVADSDGIRTATNRSGGIQGGISNGEDIYFRVAFKPVASIGKRQQTVDTHGNARTIEVRGRHDVCIVPRVVPVVESLAALVVLDFML